MRRPKRKLVAYPHRHFGTDIGMLKNGLIDDLQAISEMVGRYEATEACYEWGEQWYKEHWFKEHKHLEGEKFQAYLARKQTHIHKTAMVLSACESDSLMIEMRHLQRADKEITALEETMPQVYGKMNRETEMIMAADVLSFIKSKGSCDRMLLYREFFKMMSYNTFSNILESLRNTGLVGLKTFKGEGIKVYYVEEKKDEQGNKVNQE